MYFWTAATECLTSGDAPTLANVGVWLQGAQFNTVNPIDWHTLNNSYPVAAQFGTDPGNLWRSSVAGAFYVPPYYGINCRRIRSMHSAVHGNTVILLKQSGGECY